MIEFHHLINNSCLVELILIPIQFLGMSSTVDCINSHIFIARCIANFHHQSKDYWHFKWCFKETPANNLWIMTTIKIISGLFDNSIAKFEFYELLSGSFFCWIMDFLILLVLQSAAFFAFLFLGRYKNHSVLGNTWSNGQWRQRPSFFISNIVD
jgi:hypothetical protein